MKPIFFKNQFEFREWLSKNHDKDSEIQVGFYKVGSGKESMTYSESVDQALCFGWIDGVRHSIDNISYMNRFTPRKPKSNWSEINIKKVEDLIKKKLMQPTGLKLFENRIMDKSGVYSYENKPKRLPPKFERFFKVNIEAWKFFSNQSPSYKRTNYYWIMSAKQEATQLSRLKKLINASEQKKRLL